MSTAAPFIVLPAPLLRNGRFEYRIPDLMQSFEGARARAEDRLCQCAQEECKTRRHAALSAIFMKSGEILNILTNAEKSGTIAVSAASMITDGVRPVEGQPNNTFLEQLRRAEIDFVTEDRQPA